MIVGAVVRRMSGGPLLTTGEPVELARRFCIANRFYGSRILIGPRTFELASKTIVARPIDFLSGVEVAGAARNLRTALAGGAKRTRNKSPGAIHSGTASCFTAKSVGPRLTREFQKARGPDGEDDAPLQLYLRRLEPLALHLTNVG